MSRWGDAVVETAGEAKRFWAEAPRETLFRMMDTPRGAWVEWLRVAAGVITEPGSVFEPGCGIGLLAEVLPPGCTYYGCDINQGYVEEAVRTHGGPGRAFEHRDLDDVLDSGRTFDWVVVTSLFGMFPEDETYRMIPRFWNACRRGISVTTSNQRRFPSTPRLKFEFTCHDPDELAGVELPGAIRREIHEGTEFPRFRGHHWARGLVLYAWRERATESRLKGP